MSLFRRIFWKRCHAHGISFDSDFCPQCVRARVIRQETRERVHMEQPALRLVKPVNP